MKRNWEFLVNIFSKINRIQDESKKEYILYQLSKRYDISIESIEKIFALYQEKAEREKLKSEMYLVGSLLVKLESWLDIIHHRLKMMAIFPILEQLAKLSIIVGIVLFVTEFTGRRQERHSQRLQTHYEAWDIIKSHEERDRSSGGRKEAIEYLSKEGVDLSGINLKNASLERIKINQSSWISKIFKINDKRQRFLWVNLENAVINEGDFSNSLLYYSDFKKAQLWNNKFNNSALARTNFEGSDLQGADLENADLRCASFIKVQYIEVEQIKKGTDWELAVYDPEFAHNKLKLEKTRNNLDILDNTTYSKEIIDNNDNLKSLNFHCYGFQVNYDRDNKQSNLEKIHNRFYIFKEYVYNNFKDADFRYAYLEGVDLSKANLENADLSGAYLNKTNFEGANLRDADLTKTKKLRLDQIRLSCNWNEAKLDKEITKKLRSREDKSNIDCSKWNRDGV